MNKFLPYIIGIISFSTLPVFAEDKIGGSLENVDLYVEDVYNPEGHNCGERYTAHNRNSFPMRLSIKLTEGENVDEHLIEHIVIVDPFKKVELGYVTQDNPAQGSSWKYEWRAQKDSR